MWSSKSVSFRASSSSSFQRPQSGRRWPMVQKGEHICHGRKSSTHHLEGIKSAHHRCRLQGQMSSRSISTWRTFHPIAVAKASKASWMSMFWPAPGVHSRIKACGWSMNTTWSPCHSTSARESLVPRWSPWEECGWQGNPSSTVPGGWEHAWWICLAASLVDKSSCITVPSRFSLRNSNAILFQSTAIIGWPPKYLAPRLMAPVPAHKSIKKGDKLSPRSTASFHHVSLVMDSVRMPSPTSTFAS